MRMKNRFSKMGKSLLGAACLLSSCVITYSCSDDYDLPDTKPGFLGESIYDELKKRGNFTVTVRLIDDLDYAEVLSKTGSKTLFVAADTSYENFFNTTNWVNASGDTVRSYEQLTLDQKKQLLNSAMLNNAYVMEMLPNTAGGGKNLCLRQATAATALDAVAHFDYDELPVITNKDDENYWAEYADPASGGIYMALDRTRPYMTHFLEGHMNNRNIKKSDVAFVLNRPGAWTDDGGVKSFIYDREVVQQDVTCLNGYINVLDGVLIPPSNMAEEIRKNGDTQHFSHLLERFSAPFYSEELTQEYSALHDIQGQKVFQKRYFAERSQNNSKITEDPNEEPIGDFPFLSYDPGWNTLAVSNTAAPETDMAAMFVPNDAAMLAFFKSAQGAVLMKEYAELQDPASVLTHENLDLYTDMIPLNIVRALVNNLMKESFSESVPSKYTSIMNDARDPMFALDYKTVDDYKRLIDKCILANNGVVYVINNVVSPADYAAVSAPVLIMGETDVVNTAIRIDDSYVNGDSYANAPLQQYFSTYLKSMQSSFSFFVPTDSALANYGYINPVTFNMGRGRVREKWTFKIDDTKKDAIFPIEGRSYVYDESQDNMSLTHPDAEQEYSQKVSGANSQVSELRSGLGRVKTRLLIEMINQHILVHDNNDMEGVRKDNGPEYFESRSGAPVRVNRASITGENGKGMTVEGGHQMLRNSDTIPVTNDQLCTVIVGYDQRRRVDGSTEGSANGNGMTYFLDRPIEPTYRSVWNVLKSDADFKEFFDLVEGNMTLGELQKMGYRDSGLTETEWRSKARNYQLMVGVNEISTMNPAAGEKLVRFFNNYRYTIYIPTNAAVQNAVANGLPTWKSIKAVVNNSANLDKNGLLTPEKQIEAKAMLTQLLNTLRYHFQDKALYVDNVNDDESYQTSSLDEVNNKFRTLKVKRVPGQMTVNGIKVDDVKKNLLARDLNFSDYPTNAGEHVVESSSPVVLHQIDGILDFQSESSASPYKRYSEAWNTPAKAKAFVEKYKISK